MPAEQGAGSYRIAVDIGGTFTDCAVVPENGERVAAKALTTPGRLDDGVLDAVRVAAEQLGLTLPALLSATEIFVHGTTQATNAILTRTGARTGLITTRGHEDSLIIGRVYSKMAGLDERDVVHSSRLTKPAPIVRRALIRGVAERIDRDGDVVAPLQESQVVAATAELLELGVEAIAVCFLWSFVNPAHERRVSELLAEQAPHVFTAVSHEIAPVVGEYERAATTAMTAYVGPTVAGYLRRLEDRLRGAGLARPLLVMQASGGLTSVDDAARRPLVTLDSGPTGGILGSKNLGGLMGEQDLICTDVGGTSFDVGLVLGGDAPRDDEPVVGQYSLRMPKVLVKSIGSGGGSIAWVDHGLLRVGPQSAGAAPGPACYGLGGAEPTVTDADLVLGYLDPDNFLAGRMRLYRDRALEALSRLGVRLGMEPEEVALGIFRIINAQMADLILRSTIEQGHDPRTCVLIAYGGAGPTHAAFYAGDIGAKSIVIPADSTVFSAEGMLTCDLVHTAEVSRQTNTPFSPDELAGIRDRFTTLEERVVAQFERDGAARANVRVTRTISARFRHQVHGLEIPVPPGRFDERWSESLVDRFTDRYEQVYGAGAVLRGGGVEIDLHRVIGTRLMPALPPLVREAGGPDASAAHRRRRLCHFEPDGFVTTDIFDGGALRPGNVIAGPAIVERMGDSVVIPPEYGARVDDQLTLTMAPVRSPMDKASVDMEVAHG